MDEEKIERQPTKFQKDLIDYIRTQYAIRIGERYNIGEQVIMAHASQPDYLAKEIKHKMVQDTRVSLDHLTHQIGKLETERDDLIGFIMENCVT